MAPEGLTLLGTTKTNIIFLKRAIHYQATSNENIKMATIMRKDITFPRHQMHPCRNHRQHKEHQLQSWHKGSAGR